MNLGLGSTLLPGDPRLIDHIVGEVKSQGIFDQFRKDCIADVDTKPAYQNLRTRVESSVNSFLSKQRWRADLNKNQLRETLRKHISDGPYLDTGVERIVDQVVNPKIYSVFMPQIEDVVHEFMGLEKPKRAKNGPCGLKDLLPKDLDPVSPESDKNSLKDVSLDSVDANLTVPGEEEDLNLKKELEEIDVKVECKTEEFVAPENEISNGEMEEEAMEEPMDLEGNTPPPPELNDSGQSEEKEEEEEEDSPVFEPIDIMNMNESNDSHLSGISELTSHRSRSPDFSNDFSRDNFDFSNQDSQLSKVSSDSRLSIVTDFGSSNQPTTPVPEVQKDENSKDTFSKDNFIAIRDEGEKIKDDIKVDAVDKQKENLLEMKDGSDTMGSKTNLSSKESSRDGTESIKDKSEHKSKERTRDSGKSRSSKERSESRESRSHRDKRKSNQSESSDKSKSKEKSENSRDSSEKIKESKEVKENKETPTKVKESPSKEGKDLKDIYKEKIRELREKKELTEKEKLGKDNKESREVSKDAKSVKESKEKRDSSRDKEKRRSSSSRTHSSSRHESRSSKSSKDDSKSSKSEKEKTKRDESSRSREGKSRSKSESNDKSESKKVSKSDKDDKSEAKSDSKTQKSTGNHRKSDSKSSEKSEKREDSKDKKRKDEKKTKSKDDHSSLRKGTRDRRSSDRDGSSGSSGRGSQKSNSSPSTSTSKASSSSLGKESSTNSNSSSETSDGVDESQTEEFKPSEVEIKEEKKEIKLEKSEVKLEKSDIKFEGTEIKMEGFEMKVEKSEMKIEKIEVEETTNPKRIDPGQIEISLPLKKRPLQSEEVPPRSAELPIKKPKFARNFAEAKKLMKIRKRIEKEKQKGLSSADSISPVSELSEISEAEGEVLPPVPDEERVQIIKVMPDEEDEPYPETECNLTLDETSRIILTEDEILNTEIVAKLKTKSTLSEMESSIRQSLNEMITDKTHGDNALMGLESSTDLEMLHESTSIGGSSNTTDNIDDRIGSENVLEFREEIKAHKEEAESNPDERTIKSSTEPSEEKPLDIPQDSGTPGTSCGNPELSDDEEDVRYFIPDYERLNRFTQFLNSLELNEDDSAPAEVPPEPSESKRMAPPSAKRKYSTSPLSDILLSNSNNNNEGPKLESYEDEGQPVTKKKKMGRPKKQRLSVNSPSPQMNSENFALPMSPESDVSASSDNKNPIKEERNRPRGSNQRYTSDDLYKPRPLFASSSRRSRRSNP